MLPVARLLAILPTASLPNPAAPFTRRNFLFRKNVLTGVRGLDRKRSFMHTRSSSARVLLFLMAQMVLWSTAASAQTVPPLEEIKSQAELETAVTALDAALFDSYNRCDLQKFASFMADDVEFYHDKGGVTLGKEALTDSIKKNICGKVTRELVPGSLQVYPMKGYGALETGTHRFHHPGHEDTEGVGEAQFIHLWQYKNGAWKITRVISYDHHGAAK
jgi:ketosteroid isomerase-like protein